MLGRRSRSRRHRSPVLRMLGTQMGFVRDTFTLRCSGTSRSVLLDCGTFVQEGGATANLVGHPGGGSSVKVYGGHRTWFSSMGQPFNFLYRDHFDPDTRSYFLCYTNTTMKTNTPPPKPQPHACLVGLVAATPCHQNSLRCLVGSHFLQK